MQEIEVTTNRQEIESAIATHRGVMARIHTERERLRCDPAVAAIQIKQTWPVFGVTITDAEGAFLEEVRSRQEDLQRDEVAALASIDTLLEQLAGLAVRQTEQREQERGEVQLMAERLLPLLVELEPLFVAPLLANHASLAVIAALLPAAIHEVQQAFDVKEGR